MKHVDWSKRANIYEVNLRQYTKEGTINAFRPHLQRLKDMSVDILWFMPVHPIGEKNRKGTLGSFYAAKDYKAVNIEFGTIEDFKQLVNEAHKLGMYVLLDWVANHSGWDHVWTLSNPEFYQKDDNGQFKIPWDWDDVIALDYDNPEMRLAMIDAMNFWVKETNIDGFRCDMAGMVPVDFWNQARESLEQTKPMFMLAEDEEVVSLLDFAFDMNFTWEMHHLMNAIAKGEEKASEIIWKYLSQKEKYPEKAYRMYFTSNHDENSHSGTAVERMGEAAKTFAALSYLLPGMALTYSGQETGTDKRLEFFEKDEISWNEIPLAGFYTTLNTLKHKNKALWSGRYGGDLVDINQGQNDSVVAFTREMDGDRIITVLNLSNQQQHFVMQNDNLAGAYRDVFSNEEIYPSIGFTFELQAWDFIILSNQKD